MSKAPQKHRFVRLSHDCSSCICRPEEVADLTAGEDPAQPFEREEVWMTEAAYERLPEFEGW